MHELTHLNILFKIKIHDYQKEYYQKKGITNPLPEDIIRMRRSLCNRLKKETQVLDSLHTVITNRVYESETTLALR